MRERVEEIERRIIDLKLELSRARREVSAQRAAGYAFPSLDGRGTRLSDLFGGRRDLLVVHNMGRRCASGTLWADGFTGVWRHLESRAAFAPCSPDGAAVQREFAASRGWEFRTISAAGASFHRDMGFEPAPGRVAPGVSAFRLNADSAIDRVGRYASFGPGDHFCPVYCYEP